MIFYDFVMMVSFKEFKLLVDYYKGNIIESILLNEVVYVVVEVRVLMDDIKMEFVFKEF